MGTVLPHKEAFAAFVVRQRALNRNFARRIIVRETSALPERMRRRHRPDPTAADSRPLEEGYGRTGNE